MSLPTPPPDLNPYFDELERFADGQLSPAEQEAFEVRLEQDEALAAAHAAYEQLTADLRWAAGHDALRLRLQALNERMDQRALALARVQRQAQLRRQRWLMLGALVLLLVLAAGAGTWYLRRPGPARPAGNWEAYYEPDPGPVVTPALLQRRPLFSEALDQYQAGHYPAALHSLGRVLPGKVGADTLLYLRGLMLLRQGQGGAAQLYLRRVSQPGDLARRARYHLAMAYWQAQQRPAALLGLRAVAADSLNPYRAAARRAIASGRLTE